MRVLAFTGGCFLLLVLQSALGILFPVTGWSPNLLLPLAIYLGVIPSVSLVRGALLAFAAGYLLDLFSGNGFGLMTLILLASFLISRVSGLNLFMRGPLFQVGLTFVFATLAGGAALSLQAIFGGAQLAFGWDGDAWLTARTVSAGAALTAVFSPFLYGGARRMDFALQPRRTGGGAAL